MGQGKFDTFNSLGSAQFKIYWEVNKVGINFRKLYESRIEEIEIQIKRAIGFKQWDKKAKLEIEKKRLLEKIKTF